MATAVMYTMFYDRSTSAATRVTDRNFILTSDATLLYTPPGLWLPQSASSPILINGPASKANTLTTLDLDLTGLTRPPYNPFASVVTSQYLTVNENAQNTVTMAGTIFNQSHTYFLRPGSHDIRTTPAGTLTARVAEYVIVFQSPTDWTHQVALSVLLTQVADPLSSAALTPDAAYFAALQTGQSTEQGRPLADLIGQLSVSGVFTYEGTDLLPPATEPQGVTAGTRAPMTWVVFEATARICAGDLARLWAVADPSGDLWAGPLTPSVPLSTGVVYLTSSVKFPGKPDPNNRIISAQQCVRINPKQYYDPTTGVLRAGVEGGKLVTVDQMMSAPDAAASWLQTSREADVEASAAADTSGDVTMPAVDARPIENLIALVVSLIIAVAVVGGVVFYLLRRPAGGAAQLAPVTGAPVTGVAPA